MIVLIKNISKKLQTDLSTNQIKKLCPVLRPKKKHNAVTQCSIKQKVEVIKIKYINNKETNQLYKKGKNGNLQGCKDWNKEDQKYI